MIDPRAASRRGGTAILAPLLGVAFLVLPALPALSGFLQADLEGQSVRVSREETFRQTAGGRRLGTVMEGAELRTEGTEGAWRRVVLEGWIWTPSIAATSRGGFDRVVAAGGENLRAGPSPEEAIVARLLPGFLLELVEERGRWSRVRRTGWVAEAAVTTVRATAGGAGGAAPEEEVGAPPGVPGETAEVGSGTVGLLLSPGGDTTAVVRSGAQLGVMERREGWARVRLDGWVPVGDLVRTAADSAVADVSAADLEANPDKFRDRRVRWTVQFISLERAEAVRTDFYEGEPFILARAPEPSRGFVYLAVPEPLLSRVEELRPLQSIEVLARVRTGRSALMGVPVLELITIY